MRRAGLLLALLWPAAGAAGTGEIYRYFEPFPEDPSVEFLDAGAAAADRPTRVYYHWATWCEPCKIAKALLADAAARHPGQLAVVALTSEPRETVTARIATDATLRGFRLGLRKKSETRDPPYLPYVVVVHRDEVVWKGNPTYPAGRFEGFLGRLLEDRWDRAAHRTRVEAEAATDARLATLAPRSVESAAALVESIRATIELLKQKQARDPNNYYYVFRTISLTRLAIQVDSTLGRKPKGWVSEQIAELARYIKTSAEAFRGSRDDLAFLARDVIFADDERFRDAELGHALVEMAFEAPAAGQYAHLAASLRAEDLALRKDWAGAVRWAATALQLAREAGLSGELFQIYQDELKRYRTEAARCHR